MGNRQCPRHSICSATLKSSIFRLGKSGLEIVRSDLATSQLASTITCHQESVDYASAYQDKALDLPFVSPDSGEVYDRYMMGELVQAASGAALGDVSVNLLNAEYAILASEGRLRHTLSGDSIDSTNKF